MYGHFKGRSNSRSNMLGSQIPSIQGFGVSYFDIRHWNLGRQFEKLSFEGYQKGHEDADDDSHQSVFFDCLSYNASRISRTFYRILRSQAYYGLSTMAWRPIPLLVSTIVASFSQHLVQIDNHVEYIMGSISLGKLWQHKHIKNNNLMTKSVLVAKEWNFVHFSGKKPYYLHLKDFLKY